jgi:hypothetical protein
MHTHYLPMMRTRPSADAEGRHSEGKKPYSFKRVNYKQMEDLDFKDLERYRRSKVGNPCSGHKNLDGGFIPLSIKCDEGVQEIQFEVSSDFVSPVIVADEDGLSFGNKPIEKNTINHIGTGGTLMTFDPANFSGDGIEIICIDVIDSVCGGKSTFCMFLIGCDNLCGDCDCESEDDCVDDCCMTEGGTPEEITAGGTKQYTCGSSGTWSVEGVGLSIDQDGLLSADAGTACGVGIVSHSTCQDKVVRVQGNGSYWNQIDSAVTACSDVNDCNQESYSVTSGAYRYSGDWYASALNTSDCDADIEGGSRPGVDSGACPFCFVSGNPVPCIYIYKHDGIIEEWVCP